MQTIRLRKVGGSVRLAVPPALLDLEAPERRKIGSGAPAILADVMARVAAIFEWTQVTCLPSPATPC